MGVKDSLDAMFRCLRLNEKARRLRVVVVVHKLAHEGTKSDMLEKSLEKLCAICQYGDVSF